MFLKIEFVYYFSKNRNVPYNINNIYPDQNQKNEKRKKYKIKKNVRKN